MNSYSLLPLSQPLTAQVTIPGSKSYTNRALIMAALAKGKSVLIGISESDDSIALLAALKQFGITFEQSDDNVIIHGSGGKFRPYTGSINVGAAGTTMRFLTSLCALIPGEITLDGSERMRERPIRKLIDALRQLGVKIEYEINDGCPPIRIYGGNLKGGKVQMDGSFSSQYFTSLLLVAPVLQNGIEIEVVGKQISPSYIDMTIDGLQAFGVKVINDNYQKYTVAAGSAYPPQNYHVEADASGASYFWAIAAITGSTIRTKNINPHSAQGDVKFVDILELMGCKVVKNTEKNWIEVTGGNDLKGVEVNMESMPDTAQTLAVVAAFAHGTTKITGLSTLRIKETDRLAALQIELKKIGIESNIGADWIEIKGGNPHGAEIATYKDHRMAMSFAVAGSKISGVVIKDPSVVTKSFPKFWELVKSLGVDYEQI